MPTNVVWIKRVERKNNQENMSKNFESEDTGVRHYVCVNNFWLNPPPPSRRSSQEQTSKKDPSREGFMMYIYILEVVEQSIDAVHNSTNLGCMTWRFHEWFDRVRASEGSELWVTAFIWTTQWHHSCWGAVWCTSCASANQGLLVVEKKWSIPHLTNFLLCTQTYTIFASYYYQRKVQYGQRPYMPCVYDQLMHSSILWGT